MLIVEDDHVFARGLQAEAEDGGFRVEHAASLEAAKERLAQEMPDFIVLDLMFPGSPDGGLVFLEELSEVTPPPTIFVVTAGQEFVDRVDAANLGGRGFFQKPVEPSEIVGAATQMLQDQAAERSKVLAVDDDSIVLDAIKAILETSGVSVRTLDVPSRVMSEVEDFEPDLMILDVTMPAINGIEVCRALRSDFKWRDLPILFLTSLTDASTVASMFDAGADDYIRKPLVGPELVSRINNRLDRVRTLRSLADSDGVTGLPNRTAFGKGAARLITRAATSGQSLSIAVVSIDRITDLELEDPEGADTIVKRASRVLMDVFRGDDVLSYWGGGRFFVCMYGMNREEAVNRVAGALETLREENLLNVSGREFSTTFSSGVARYPEDGEEPIALVRTAGKQLNRALQAGGDRVVSTGSDRSAPAGQVDVVLVDDDESLAAVLTHALDSRGYSSQWISDGHVAVESLTGPESTLVPRMVLLDVNLPGLDGLAVLRRIREESRLENTRVVMLTARASEKEVLRALDLGAFDHIAKPFSLQILMRRVRRALMS